MSSRGLTIIEQTILGIVFSQGQCSRYAVMIELRESGSGYYRSMASAAYPAVKRLVRFGYVQQSNTKPHIRLQITDQGMDQLRAWILCGADSAEISQTRDLLRLRVFFLRSLERDTRQKLLASALAQLRTYLAVTRADYEASLQRNDPFEKAGLKGSMYEAEARVRWLEDVFDSLAAGV